MPAQTTLGQRPPVLLESFACRLQASWGSEFSTSSYHPNNGWVERVNHSMAQRPSMVVNELQNNEDEQLPHVEFAYNDSVSAATGLASNEVHMGRLPRLSLKIFERTGVAGHQSLVCDHLAYCDDRLPAARVRCRPRIPCPHSLSHGRAQLSPLRRTARGPQIRH